MAIRPIMMEETLLLESEQITLLDSRPFPFGFGEGSTVRRQAIRYESNADAGGPMDWHPTDDSDPDPAEWTFGVDPRPHVVALNPGQLRTGWAAILDCPGETPEDRLRWYLDNVHKPIMLANCTPTETRAIIYDYEEAGMEHGANGATLAGPVYNAWLYFKWKLNDEFPLTYQGIEETIFELFVETFLSETMDYSREIQPLSEGHSLYALVDSYYNEYSGENEPWPAMKAGLQAAYDGYLGRVADHCDFIDVLLYFKVGPVGPTSGGSGVNERISRELATQFTGNLAAEAVRIQQASLERTGVRRPVRAWFQWKHEAPAECAGVTPGVRGIDLLYWVMPAVRAGVDRLMLWGVTVGGDADVVAAQLHTWLPRMLGMFEYARQWRERQEIET